MRCWSGCLEQSTNGLHMIQLMPLPAIMSCFFQIQIGLTLLVPAYPGCLEKETIKLLTLLFVVTFVFETWNKFVL